MLAPRALAAALLRGPATHSPAARLLPHRRVCASTEAPAPEPMAPKRKAAAATKASGGVAKKKAAKPAAAPPPATVVVSATDIAIEACKS